MKRISLYFFAYIFVYIVVGIIVLIKETVYFPDSYTFLNMALNHSPVYCVFLKVITSIFGDYFEFPLKFIQYICIGLGTNFFLKTINHIFKIHKVGLIIIQLVILAPCVYLHNLGSAILSEAIAYPLILIIFGYSIRMLVEEKISYIYKIIPLLFILLLTRGQFLALIPPLLVITGYLIYKKKCFIKNIKFIIILIILPLVTNLSERVYNKIVYGYFTNNAMNYVHLISSPFYLSNPSDINLFEEEDEKAYFTLIYNSLIDEKLTLNQNLNSKIDDYQFYHQNFSNICNKRIYKLGLEFYKNKGYNYVEQNVELNKLCSKMYFPILKQNFKNWTKLFFKNFKNSFGSFKLMLLFFVLLLYGMIFTIKTNKNIYKFIFLATLFMFANNALIALVIHSIKRYTFYFDWVIFAIIILLFNEIFKQSKVHES